jgi:hypothetical protein
LACLPFIFYWIDRAAEPFFIGPMRLLQEPMESGNVEEVERILDTIWFPNLLYKPIRSTYYTVKGNMAMMKQDFDTAEKHLKKSASLGAPMPEAEGANKLQLGMMAMQKGDMRVRKVICVLLFAPAFLIKKVKPLLS